MSKSKRLNLLFRFAIICSQLLAIVVIGAPATPALAVTPFATGDVFAGVGNGFIKHLSPTGSLIEQLNTGTNCSEDLGMAFDAAGDLLTTNSFGSCFGAPRVIRFDNHGNLIGPFGSGYSSSTESISIDGSGNVFVGQPDGTHQVLEFDSNGNPLHQFSPAVEDRGTDWIDLAADQCTLLYTSEGFRILRFNVCTNTQMPDFTSTGGVVGRLFALRIRPNGEVVVAGEQGVLRLSPTATVLQTYPRPASEGSFLFALNLDPDGSTFWTAGYQTGNVYRFNIASGAMVTSFNAGRIGCCLSGLSVFGEIRVAQGGLTLSPATATNNVGTSHTVTATATLGNQPAAGVAVNFVVSGANSASGSCVTNASGQCTFTYVGTTAGTDTITASATISGQAKSATATKTWIGAIDHSLAVDGTGYAEAPHAADLNVTGNWTVEAWFKDEDPAGFNHDFREIINKGDSNASPEAPYYILVGNGHLLAGVRSGGVNHPIDADLVFLGLDPSKWHHVAVTYRADLLVLNLWLDGNHISFQSGVPNSAGNTLPVEIGRNGAHSAKFWVGKIDDVRIWNIARMGSDISATFQHEFTGTPPAGLVANWQFNESSGTTASDFADSHVATLNGGASFSTDVHP